MWLTGLSHLSDRNLSPRHSLRACNGMAGPVILLAVWSGCTGAPVFRPLAPGPAFPTFFLLLQIPNTRPPDQVTALGFLNVNRFSMPKLPGSTHPTSPVDPLIGNRRFVRKGGATYFPTLLPAPLSDPKPNLAPLSAARPDRCFSHPLFPSHGSGRATPRPTCAPIYPNRRLH